MLTGMTADVERSLAPGMRVVIGTLLAILALLVVAVAGIFVLVHRVSAPVVTIAPPVVTTASAPVVAATAAPTASEPVASPAKVRIDSDPDGASIAEDGVALCSQTPCEIRYSGKDADPATTHALTVARAGYVAQTLTVHVVDSPLMVKLVRKAAPAGRPPIDVYDHGFQPRF